MILSDRAHKRVANCTWYGQGRTVPTPVLFDFCPRLGYNGARSLGSNEGREVALANTKSAIKRIRSSERKRQINQVYRSRAKTYVKRSRALIAAGELEEAEIMVRKAAGALDKAAQKGILHENNAARRKSRLMRHLNQAKQEAA